MNLDKFEINYVEVEKLILRRYIYYSIIYVIVMGYYIRRDRG